MGTRRVKREVAGIANAFALIERAGAFQYDGRDLPLALADMGREPCGKSRLSGKRRTCTYERDQEPEAD